MEQRELFKDPAPDKPYSAVYTIDPNRPYFEDLPPSLANIFELSADAFYAVVYAAMSGLPIQEEISRFVKKVEKAGSGFSGGKNGGEKTAGADFANDKPGGDRAAAARAALDRGDPDVLAVLKAAARVQHEIHRVTGFLRFSPGPRGIYTARCAPDYFILPALAEHFTLRFGETPWAIIDEKRGLRLSREKGGNARLVSGNGAADTPDFTQPLASFAPPPAPSAGSAELPSCSAPAVPPDKAGDFWEDLWRLYHHSITNQSRKNPELQRQFIPGRYRKYLSEFT